MTRRSGIFTSEEERNPPAWTKLIYPMPARDDDLSSSKFDSPRRQLRLRKKNKNPWETRNVTVRRHYLKTKKSFLKYSSVRPGIEKRCYPRKTEFSATPPPQNYRTTSSPRTLIQEVPRQCQVSWIGTRYGRGTHEISRLAPTPSHP